MANGALVGITSAATTAGLTATAFKLTNAEKVPQKALIKADAQGNVGKLLNTDATVYWIGQTTNYLIAMGLFPSFQDDAGATSTCFLIAIKKTSTPRDSVLCLSSDVVGSFDPIEGLTNGHYAKYGLVAKTTSVFFVSKNGTATYVYRWSEDSPTTNVKLFETTIESGMSLEEVFVSTSNENVCAMKPAISGFAGRIYCGDSSGNAWAEVSGISPPILVETLQIENNIVTTSQKINLATLAVSSRTANGSNGGLPSGFGNRSILSDGSMVARAYAGSVTYLDTSGSTTVLVDFNTNSEYQIKLAGLGTYAWSLGAPGLYDTKGTSLYRIPLSSPSWDGVNRISSTLLTKITDLSYTPSGTIFVSGTHVSGAAGYATIDSSGTISPVSAVLAKLSSYLIP